MDYILTEKQMKDFLKRCLTKRCEELNTKSVATIKNCKYPKLSLTISDNDPKIKKAFFLLFTNFGIDYDKSSPICKKMNEMYIAYMHELFGEEYLTELFNYKSEYISQLKDNETSKYKEKINALDEQLDKFSLYIEKIRKNSLNQ